MTSSSPSTLLSIDIDQDLAHLNDQPNILSHLLDEDQVIIYSRSSCCVSAQMATTTRNIKESMSISAQVSRTSPRTHPASYRPLYKSVLEYYAERLQQQINSQYIAIGFIFVVFSAIKLFMGSLGHSGFATPPDYGDFEAQRHWMELTVHTPIREWYIETDLNPSTWWRLDYPPASAFWAYITGQIAHWFYPEMVALVTSRGIEDKTTRLMMHLTVILGDLCIYLPGVLSIASVLTEVYNSLVLSRYLHASISFPNYSTAIEQQPQQPQQQQPQQQQQKSTQSNIINATLRRDQQTITSPSEQAPSPSHVSQQPTLPLFFQHSQLISPFFIFLALFCQPLLLIIDHGHFQYNSICLGLLLCTIGACLRQSWYIAAITFISCCLFKQTGLYFALPFFAFIVSSLFRQPSSVQPLQQHDVIDEHHLNNDSIQEEDRHKQQTKSSRQRQQQQQQQQQQRGKQSQRSTQEGQNRLTIESKSSLLPFYWDSLPPQTSSYLGALNTLIKLVILTILTFLAYLLPFMIDNAKHVFISDHFNPESDTTVYIECLRMLRLMYVSLLLPLTDMNKAIFAIISGQQHPSAAINVVFSTLQSISTTWDEALQYFLTEVRPGISIVLKSSVLPIVQRIFPIQRGLFEDKVSSIWCATNLFIKWAQHFPVTVLAKFSLGLTLLLLLPSVLHLFYRPTRRALCLSLTINGFAFYLASMQVHEKTVMYAMIPMTTLLLEFPLLTLSMTYASTATCYFLLIRDGQFIPFVIIQTIVASVLLYVLSQRSKLSLQLHKQQQQQQQQKSSSSLSCFIIGQTVIILGIIIAPIVAYIAKEVITFPKRYPHIPEVFLVWYGMSLFLFTLAYLTWKQFTA